MARSDRKLSAAIVLFFTAPLVAEFLLGNLSLKALPALVALTPMYGGGALLARETVRRSGRGWPSILLLGIAYAIIEEGFVTQSLFNPDYLRFHQHFLSHAWVPVLHIGAWWTLFMFNLHMFWSVSVSIALVEGLFPAHAGRPWLRPWGDSVTGLLFFAGCALCSYFTLRQDPFVASPVQFLVAALVCLALIAGAFRIAPRRPRTGTGPVPSPWITGLAAFLLGVAVLLIPAAWNWGAFGLMLAIDLGFLIAVATASRRAAWTSLHTLSLAAGGAMAYGSHAFIETPVVGGSTLLIRTGNAIFLASAVTIIFLAAQRTSRTLSAAANPSAQPTVAS